MQNFYPIDHSGDKEKIHKFLETLNVYSHGRADGETFSLAIAEAMYHSLPVVSHKAAAMGHKETMGEGGIMTSSVEEYTAALQKLLSDENHCKTLAKNAKKRFEEHLSLEANISRWVSLYECCLEEKRKENVPDEEFWDEMW